MRNMTNAAGTSILLAVALSALALSGCGAGNHPAAGRVTGKVTMDGQPLPDAQVIFAPENGRPSIGLTNSSGTYELAYIRDTKGAVPGMHQVRITTVQKSVSDQDGGAPVNEAIPDHYNVNTTLSAEVEPGNNVIDFPLTNARP